jgi:hypothetical protein
MHGITECNLVIVSVDEKSIDACNANYDTNASFLHPNFTNRIRMVASMTS